MADVRGEAVERYKLSDQQKKFQISYTKLREVSEMLEAATFRKTQELQDLRQMWQELTKQFQSLPIPQSPTKELDGMDFPAEESGVTPEGVAQGVTSEEVPHEKDSFSSPGNFNISY